MKLKKRVAISVGDLNGIGIELAIRNHSTICEYVEPLYMIDDYMLYQACDILGLDLPKDFKTVCLDNAKGFDIKPAKISAKAGAYSFASFKKAVELAREGEVDAICTLPIHKKAWEMANIPYKGHTDALRAFFNKEAIMMLGCDELFVALYTEHVPISYVPKAINKSKLLEFMLTFKKEVNPDKVGVLALNPHAGDGGVLGDEELIIGEAIKIANKDGNIFEGPLVPDIAFIPAMRKKYKYYIAMYHDQGLAPLKTLYFDESINVSLNLPILRTSVDHGTAMDIAYKNANINPKSYINAIKYIYNYNNPFKFKRVHRKKESVKLAPVSYKDLKKILEEGIDGKSVSVIDKDIDLAIQKGSSDRKAGYIATTDDTHYWFVNSSFAHNNYDLDI